MALNRTPKKLKTMNEEAAKVGCRVVYSPSRWVSDPDAWSKGGYFSKAFYYVEYAQGEYSGSTKVKVFYTQKEVNNFIFHLATIH